MHRETKIARHSLRGTHNCSNHDHLGPDNPWLLFCVFLSRTRQSGRLQKSLRRIFRCKSQWQVEDGLTEMIRDKNVRDIVCDREGERAVCLS